MQGARVSNPGFWNCQRIQISDDWPHSVLLGLQHSGIEWWIAHPQKKQKSKHVLPRPWSQSRSYPGGKGKIITCDIHLKGNDHCHIKREVAHIVWRIFWTETGTKPRMSGEETIDHNLRWIPAVGSSHCATPHNLEMSQKIIWHEIRRGTPNVFVLDHHGKVPQQSFQPEESKSSIATKAYRYRITGRYSKYSRIPCFSHLQPDPPSWPHSCQGRPSTLDGNEVLANPLHLQLPAKRCASMVWKHARRVLLNACTGDGFKKINAARICNIHQSSVRIYIYTVYM